MAATYSAAVRSPSLTAAGVLADIRTTATDRVFLRELGVSVGVAGAAPTVGIVRPSTIGTASTTAAGQPDDVADPAATAVMGSAWSGAPTLAATPIHLRRVTLPASLGAGWVWTWPPGEELVVPISSSLIVYLIGLSAATATAVDVYARWVE